MKNIHATTHQSTHPGVFGPLSGERRRDMRRLRETFLREFDESRLQQLFRHPTPNLPKLGEGAHFTAFRIRGKHLDLALKVSRQERFCDDLPRRRADWLRLLTRLEGAEIPAIPPMRILREEGRLGLIMPMADRPWKDMAAHWQPEDQLRHDVIANLRSHGVELGDLFQGGSWDGIPFLFDFSDIRLLP
jgi:hypothetical protein